MLAQLDDLKAALGIDPAEADAARDITLNSALAMASALISGYIGIDLSDTETEQAYVAVLEDGANYVKLPAFPIIEVRGFTSNDTPVDASGYLLRPREGIIELYNGLGHCSMSGRLGQRILISYRAGYEEIPDDLKMVALNMAAAIYNMGGSFSSAKVSGAGALKTLTMFDAMAMSFDTGSSASASATPENDPSTPIGMLKQWSFILKKYQIDSVVMA